MIFLALGSAAAAITLAWIFAATIGSRIDVPDEKRRIGSIDGLRGYLALAVMISHFWYFVDRYVRGSAWADGASHIVVNAGHGPVVIFFMITGLLFYPRIRNGITQVDWIGLLISRLFRIYPLVAASILVIVGMTWLISGRPTDWRTVEETARSAAHWFVFQDRLPLFGLADSYLSNAGVFWTLAYEWLFYLSVLPLIAGCRTLTKRWLPRSVTPLWCIPIAGAYYVIGSEFAPYLLPFMLGMVVYEMREVPWIRRACSRNDVGYAALALVIAAMIFKGSPAGTKNVLLYAPFFTCVACGQTYANLLANRASLVLGEISFGIYVLHGIILTAFFRSLDVGPGANVPVLAATVMPLAGITVAALASAAYQYIERPMIGIGKRLRDHRNSKRKLGYEIV